MDLLLFFKRHKVISLVGIVLVLVIFYLYGQGGISSFSRATSGSLSFGTPQATGGRAFSELAYDKSRAIGSIPPYPSDPYGSGEDIVIDDAKVIKNASMNIEVDSVTAAIFAIENIAKSLNGFVLNSAASEDRNGNKLGSVAVKVPVSTFDEARNKIKEIAVFIKNESTNTRDVTEEFIDIEARLVNLRAQEVSFRTLLNRALKIEDIITITNSLTNVRSRIESTEGRKRYLEGQTDFSTINVSLSEDREISVPSKKWRPLTVFKDAARNTVNQLQGFIDNTFKFLFWTIGIIPYVLVAAAIFWFIKRFRRG